ncbi:hypothetical protein [Arthrobacter pigmenti]
MATQEFNDDELKALRDVASDPPASHIAEHWNIPWPPRKLEAQVILGILVGYVTFWIVFCFLSAYEPLPQHANFAEFFLTAAGAGSSAAYLTVKAAHVKYSPGVREQLDRR